MIKPSFFYQQLKNNGVEYFTGVPDSLLKYFCAYVADHTPRNNHIIAANEGGAVGLALGYHFATEKLPMVYMQNSGLGNAVNPLLSLADIDVYSVPMLLLIGWRGEPNIKDEPQHVKQGKVTTTMLETMGIPYEVIDGDESKIVGKIEKASQLALEKSIPVALVIKKGTFATYTMQTIADNKHLYKREDAVKAIVDQLSPHDIVVSTTGMASRELFEYRQYKGQSHCSDFLTVGGMGHASQIALAIAAQKEHCNVFCVDGDGAALMHLGSMAINGQSGLNNLKHIVINNGAHDSVGGQPTVANEICLQTIAKGCGYSFAQCCESLDNFQQYFNDFLHTNGPAFLEIKVNKGNRKDLGRPTVTPQENKHAFMKNLKG